MAFTTTERQEIREYMGFTTLYLQSQPRLENAITVVQSTIDGGQQVDNSVELSVRDKLTELASIETKIIALEDCLENVRIDKIEVDPARAIMMLERRGRRVIGVLGRILNTLPLADYFSAGKLQMGSTDEYGLATGLS